MILFEENSDLNTVCFIYFFSIVSLQDKLSETKENTLILFFQNFDSLGCRSVVFKLAVEDEQLLIVTSPLTLLTTIDRFQQVDPVLFHCRVSPRKCSESSLIHGSSNSHASSHPTFNRHTREYAAHRHKPDCWWGSAAQALTKSSTFHSKTSKEEMIRYQSHRLKRQTTNQKSIFIFQPRFQLWR